MASRDVSRPNKMSEGPHPAAKNIGIFEGNVDPVCGMTGVPWI